MFKKQQQGHYRPTVTHTLQPSYCKIHKMAPACDRLRKYSYAVKALRDVNGCL